MRELIPPHKGTVELTFEIFSFGISGEKRLPFVIKISIIKL